MNAKSKKCAAADCGNKASPTSPGGFCSYHATKEGSQFPGSKSKVAKSPRADAATKSTTSTKKKAGGGDIFDRLTDHNNYTGVYKERFDDDGKGKGVNLTTSHTNQNDLSDLADRTASDVRGLKITDDEEKKSSSSGKPKAKKCADSSCSNKASPTSPGGFCSYHATKEGSHFPGTKSKVAKSPRAEAATKSTTSTKKKAGGGDIFDRLTDHNNYTGVYKERFDEDGKGKGVNLTTSHQGGTQLNDLLDRTPADVRGRKV